MRHKTLRRLSFGIDDYWNWFVPRSSASLGLEVVVGFLFPFAPDQPSCFAVFVCSLEGCKSLYVSSVPVATNTKSHVESH